MIGQTWFAVKTANPDLAPLAVYEIGHGTFETPEAAMPTVNKLLKEGKHVQVVKCRVEVVERNFCWYNAETQE